MGGYHVLPVGDAVDHDGSDDCVCGPTNEAVHRADGSVVWVVIHHALDGREIAHPMEGR